MANPDHLSILNKGVDNWNSWRAANPTIRPDLQGANLTIFQNLSRVNFKEALMKEVNLSGCDLNHAYLDNAYLRRANLSDANLTKAGLSGANLRHAILQRADLTRAYLRRADLSYADLSNTTMTKTVLEYARFVDTNVEGSTLTGNCIYGASVWNIKGTPKEQSNLIITPQIAKRQVIGSGTEAIVTVDDLEVAQLIYLILNNQKLRHVIGTMTSKTVLILGRFTPERKVILETIADELRNHNLIPIIFDFERAESRDFTETIKILAGLSLFVIADITNPKSAPLELQAIVPDYQIPFVPIIQQDEKPFSMFVDLTKYDWVLKLITYTTSDDIKRGFEKGILERTWQKRKELELKKAVGLESISIGSFFK